jgi:hypothetical protein
VGLTWRAAAVLRISCTILNTCRLCEVLRYAILRWKHSVGIIGAHRFSQANVCHASDAPRDLVATIAIARSEDIVAGPRDEAGPSSTVRSSRAKTS